MSLYSLGYLCYICDEKNKLIVQKNYIWHEARDWQYSKHLGKADVCFEEYEQLNNIMATKTAHIKQVCKLLNMKPVYDSMYCIQGIEMKPGKPQKSQYYITVADSITKIKELAEQYIIESILLGNPGDPS